MDIFRGILCVCIYVCVKGNGGREGLLRVKRHRFNHKQARMTHVAE